MPITLNKKISCLRIWVLARFEYLKVISETSVCN